MAYYERLNIKDIFQEEVFTDEVMQRYMSEDAYRALKDVCVLAPWVYENK